MEVSSQGRPLAAQAFFASLLSGGTHTLCLLISDRFRQVGSDSHPGTANNGEQ